MGNLKNRKRSQADIDAQIVGLQKYKERIPRTTVFGDSNWDKIDAQIAVLNGSKTPDDYYIDETSDEYQDGDNDLWSEAERAQRWKNGEESDDLFE